MAGRRKAASSDGRAATKRMVLERVEALVYEPGEKEGQRREVWIERGEFEGDRQALAIEQYAGKPGTPDAKVGVFKAPPVSAWKGGVRYVAPPVPLVQRELL